MAIRLGSNPLSLGLQSSLNKTDTTLSKTSERLSSGLRINRGSDDAAGLSISQSLNLNAKVYSQGVRNLNDGISAINIADGAIDGLNTILSRIEEIAMQSANGTLSDTQRTVMQQEVTALQAEWNRIVDTTTFNGQQLLTGSTTRMVLQGGTQDTGTLAVQVGKEALAGGVDDYAGGTSEITTGTTTTGNQVVAISADGRYVAIQGATSFVKDTVTGASLSVPFSGTIKDLSPDGRYILSLSLSNDLITTDRQSGTSKVATPPYSPDSSFDIKMSADGRYVTYTNSNGSDDYRARVYDTQLGVTTVVSTDSSGAELGYYTYSAAISGDGRYVVFNSELGVSSVKDRLTGKLTTVSTSSSGVQANNTSTAEAISADGRYVAFNSTATNLVSGDTNAVQDAFVKDTVTGVTTRVSTSSSGAQSNGHSYVTGMSADGRYVTFYSSASNLVTGDTNGLSDAFIKDTVTGVTTRVNVSSAGVQANGASNSSMAISADGRYVSFGSTATNLATGDADALSDVFLRDLSKAGVQTLAGMVVNNKASAVVTMNLVQNYRNELIDYRGKLGTSTSRLVSYMGALNIGKLNLIAASSVITDADVASESATFVAASTRRQSASSLLAQANLVPEVALALLRNL